MLESLDTLIAFVLIMSVVSLLVTILVHIVGTSLNLRGQNLARGLSEAFQTVAPNAFPIAGAKENGGSGKPAPATSEAKAGESQKGASRNPAQSFAEYLLQSSKLSDHAFRWSWLPKTATAVRPQEIFDTLVQMAKLGSDGEMGKKAKNLLDELGAKAAYDPQAQRQQLDEILSRAEQGLAAIPELKGLSADIAKARQTAVTAENAIDATARSVTEAWQRFSFWFDATQDRAQQWFATQTRICTILISIGAAFVFQLDTVEIYSEISADRTVRDKLVATAGAFAADAERTLADTTSVLQDAFQDWQKSPEVVNASIPGDKRQALANLVPQPTETRTSFLARLHEMLVSVPNGSDLEKGFIAKLDNHVQERLKQEAQDFTRVKSDLERTGFELLPSSFSRWSPSYFDGVFKHFFGILISASLLSLGAPFWFNILNSLTNLRSLLASNIKDEEEAASDAPGKANTGAQGQATTGLPPL
jgi:hypothetical protein